MFNGTDARLTEQKVDLATKLTEQTTRADEIEAIAKESKECVSRLMTVAEKAMESFEAERRLLRWAEAVWDEKIVDRESPY